jgi:hypothetical protein
MSAFFQVVKHYTSDDSEVHVAFFETETLAIESLHADVQMTMTSADLVIYWCDFALGTERVELHRFKDTGEWPRKRVTR